MKNQALNSGKCLSINYKCSTTQILFIHQTRLRVMSSLNLGSYSLLPSCLEQMPMSRFQLTYSFFSHLSILTSSFQYAYLMWASTISTRPLLAKLPFNVNLTTPQQLSCSNLGANIHFILHISMISSKRTKYALGHQFLQFLHFYSFQSF